MNEYPGNRTHGQYRRGSGVPGTYPTVNDSQTNSESGQSRRYTNPPPRQEIPPQPLLQYNSNPQIYSRNSSSRGNRSTNNNREGFPSSSNQPYYFESSNGNRYHGPYRRLTPNQPLQYPTSSRGHYYPLPYSYYSQPNNNQYYYPNTQNYPSTQAPFYNNETRNQEYGYNTPEDVRNFVRAYKQKPLSFTVRKNDPTVKKVPVIDPHTNERISFKDLEEKRKKDAERVRRLERERRRIMLLLQRMGEMETEGLNLERVRNLMEIRRRKEDMREMERNWKISIGGNIDPKNTFWQSLEDLKNMVELRGMNLSLIFHVFTEVCQKNFELACETLIEMREDEERLEEILHSNLKMPSETLILQMIQKFKEARKEYLESLKKKKKELKKCKNKSKVVEVDEEEMKRMKEMKLVVHNLESMIICPISLDYFVDPVILIESNQTYEREAIQRWLKDNDRDPLTNQVLSNKSLISNSLVKSYLETWRKFLDLQKKMMEVDRGL